MPAYIKLSTQEYPRFEGDIRNEYPEISEDQTWPDFPCPPDYEYVNWVDPPYVEAPLQYAYEGNPKLINGQWFMTWLVGEMTQEEWDARQAEIKKLTDRHNHKSKDPIKLQAEGTAPDVIG